MYIVAVDEDLNVLDTYDLGDHAAVIGPDQKRFNYDITTPSPRQYMEVTDYNQKLILKAQHDEEEVARESAREKLRLLQGDK